MKEDHDDLLQTEHKLQKQQDRAKELAREKRIKPYPATPLQPAALLDAGINESTETDPVPFRAPFRAEGVQVYDSTGKSLCLCGTALPWDTRLRMATYIAAAMNNTYLET